MMQNYQKMNRQIMNRIHFVFWMRRVLSPTAVKLYLIGVGSLVILSYMSLGNVIANMPSILETRAFYHFTMSALFHTEAVAQVISFGMFAIMTLFVRDIFAMRVYSPEREI